MAEKERTGAGDWMRFVEGLEDVRILKGLGDAIGLSIVGRQEKVKAR